MNLQGQNVWLIGASSGIGAALAPKLAAQGATLAISARREEELQKVAAGCRGQEVLVKPLDVTDNASVKAVYEELKTAWGQVDAVIYGAGQWIQATVLTFDTEAAVQQVNVNYL